MRKHTYERGWIRWLMSLAVLAGLSAAALVLVSATSDDCWNGALSDDPLHCYVLEQAQRDGIIDVDAVYRVGGSLHFYIKESEPAWDDILEYIRRKAQEEARRSGGDDCVLSSGGCRVGVFSPDNFPGSFGEEWNFHWYILPMSEVYQTIELIPGGADARYSEPGWAAYRQVWPASGGGGVSGASDATGPVKLDVSDVDTTNFPPLDCASRHIGAEGSCGRSQELAQASPDIGFAGWHSRGGGSSKTIFIQVKVPPGREANLVAEEAKEAALRMYSRMDPDRLVMIPVKYSYEELWRWMITLNRFARSSSNTVGITWVGIRTNKITASERAVYTPESSLQEAPDGEGWDYIENGKLIRETIVVWTLDLDRTINALPEVLSQLDIPVDAVGVVAESDRTPADPGLPGVPGLSANPSSSIGAIGSTVAEAATEFRPWVLLGGAATLAVLGSVIFVIVWLLRRM